MLEKLYTKRTICRGCGSKNMIKFLDLGDMPLAGGFLHESEISQERKIPLDVFFCKDCNLVQILNVVNPVTLFKNYFYISSIIPELASHFEEYSQFLLSEYLPFEDAKLIEIGCNDGVLLKNFKNNHNVFSIGIDPSENVCKLSREKGLNVINDFFNKKSSQNILDLYGKFDVLTGSNMFAHIDDIIEIIDGAKNILHDEGVFIFEVHYLLDLIREFQYDTIYHEHLTYYSILAIKNIFESNGMKVIDVIHLEMHGGGIRVVTSLQKSQHKEKESVAYFIQKEKEFGLDNINTYVNFGAKIIEHRKELLKTLNKIKEEGNTIVGYGAPGRSTILLNYCGIDSKYLDYIVDISPLRQNMLMPGVHLEIRDTKIIDPSKTKYVLLLAWNYSESILRQEQVLIDKGVKFIIPFPKIKII